MCLSCPQYIPIKADTDNDAVDELWIHFDSQFSCQLVISSRVPMLFALVTVALALVTPESLRWLVIKQRVSEAQVILARLMAKPTDDPDMVATVKYEAEVQQPVPLKEIFTRKSNQQKLRRMLLGAGTVFFQHVGGTKVIAYYLPVVLTRSVGLSTRDSLILSASDFMSLRLWGPMAVILIDRKGRKKFMLIVVTGSSVFFALVAVGLRYGRPDN